MIVMKSLIQLIRPHQWTKNSLCMAGVIFSGRAFDPAALGLGVLVVLVFSIGSSSMYIFNDIIDRERDRQHPTKRRRPVASGALSVRLAALSGIVLAGGALASARFVGLATLICLALYMANNVAYSTILKHVGLIEVLSIAFGFVLRLLAGVYVLGELPTAWITLCTFFLALFFAVAKRRAELHSLTGEQNLQRPVLSKYTGNYLDSQLTGAAIMAIMCYALFTVTSGKTPTLVVTLPMVYYAIVHYKRLVMVGEVGEKPEVILIKDPRIVFSVLLWLSTYMAVDYWDLRLFR